jgi:hypothetical protein
MDSPLESYNAWRQMDAYFQSLYDYVRANKSSGIRILTPPMAYDNLAEPRRLGSVPGSCEPQGVLDEAGQLQAGYDLMPYTYDTKNDGFVWNNYFRMGRETWATGDPCGVSDHLFQYFPSRADGTGLADHVRNSGKLSFISEMDLFSPCQRGDNPLMDKDANPSQTSNSLWSFIGQEQGATYSLPWLLSEDPYSVVEDCHINGLVNYLEVKWHQAYEREGFQRAWFAQWWQP